MGLAILSTTPAKGTLSLVLMAMAIHCMRPVEWSFSIDVDGTGYSWCKSGYMSLVLIQLTIVTIRSSFLLILMILTIPNKMTLKWFFSVGIDFTGQSNRSFLSLILHSFHFHWVGNSRFPVSILQYFNHWKRKHIWQNSAWILF